MSRTLARALLLALAARTLVFALGALAVLVTAISAPLLTKGAPLQSLLATVPIQLGVVLPYALPLAVCAAVLVTIGRLREDGELIAVQSAGIPPQALFVLISPWLLGMGLLVCLHSLFLRPLAMSAMRSAEAELLQQGIAAQVSDQKPIISNSRQLLSASALVQGDLVDLWAFQQHDDGGSTVAFAPRAAWVWRDGLALEAQQVRLWYRDAAGSHLAAELANSRELLPLAAKPVRTVTESLSYRVLPAELRRAEQALATASARDHGAAHRQWRRVQLWLHQPWMEGATTVVLGFFALGLALHLRTHQAALSVCLSLALIIPTSLLGPLLIAGAGRTLPLHPGWLMWSSLGLLVLVGGYLLRRPSPC